MIYSLIRRRDLGVVMIDEIELTKSGTLYGPWVLRSRKRNEVDCSVDSVDRV